VSGLNGNRTVIAGFARSPFHFARKGELVDVRPDELAGRVVRALVERAGVDPASIEDVALGCAFPEGEQGWNLGRIVGVLAGLPQQVAGSTINRWCGSSMQSVHFAAGSIAMGAGEAYVCAGVESMSRVPMYGFNPLHHPGLVADYPQIYMGMGETAENVAARYGISRERQEQFAVESQSRAAKACAAGRFEGELVAIDGVTADGTIRPETTLEGLSGLKTPFLENGTVTAGTSSPLTDGAAAVLVTSASYAQRHGLQPLAFIRSIAVSGCDPAVMGIGPVSATQKALERAGITVDELDVIELNEAFAAQSLACVDELGLDPAKVNIDGGAIALGHPLGATGARITGKAAAILHRDGGRFALATQCIGGGQGIATVLEAA
jgi:acetyl-CoA acyltransferase